MKCSTANFREAAAAAAGYLLSASCSGHQRPQIDDHMVNDLVRSKTTSRWRQRRLSSVACLLLMAVLMLVGSRKSKFLLSIHLTHGMFIRYVVVVDNSLIPFPSLAR